MDAGDSALYYPFFLNYTFECNLSPCTRLDRMSPHGVKLVIMCWLISSVWDLLFVNVVRESLFGF